MACPAVGVCWGVGSYFDKTANDGEPLLYTLSSGTWQASRAPLPAGGTGGALSYLSCPSQTSCEAAGFFYDASTDIQGLLVAINSGSPSATEAPIPADATTTNDSERSIEGLSCPTGGWCVATERYTDTSGFVRYALLNLSGGTWSLMTPTSPPGGTQADVIDGATCPSVGWCLINGSYTDNAGTHQFLETYSNGTWTSTPTPLPPDAPSPTTLDANGSISCAAVQSCVATAYYGSYTDTNDGMVAGSTEMLSLDNGTWSGVTLAKPPGADELTVGPIACPQTGVCTAAAGYNHSGGSDAIVLSLANGAWTLTNVGNQSGLADISCPSTAWCASAGTSDLGPLALFIQSGGFPTQISLTSSQNPGYVGSSVTYTARVLPEPDGGTVSFNVGTAASPCNSEPVDPATGEATCTVSYDFQGTVYSSASYFGDSNFAESGPTPLFNQNIQEPPPSGPPRPAPSPTPPFEVALQGSNSPLITEGRDGLTNWNLGVAPGTSPSLIRVGTTGYEIAFQAHGGALWTVGSSGWTNWGVGMAPNTSPSMVRLANGGYEIAFQAYGGELWSIGTGGWTDWHVGMAPNTSPSLVALPNGGFEIAFQAYGGGLWSVGTAGWTNWGVGLAPNTSPSVYAPGSGGFEIAFQANGGALWSVGSAGWTNWGVGMAPNTSPSTVRLSNGGYELAFSAYGGALWTIGTAGWTNWGVGMASDSSPAIASLPNGGYEMAFQAYGGDLWTIGTAGWTHWPIGIAPDTGPAIL